MTARQSHLYRGVYPVLYTKPANDVWAEDVDLRVNFALEVGKQKLFCWNLSQIVYFKTLWTCFLSQNNQHTFLYFLLFEGKHRKFFKSGDVAIVVTGWRPGSGYTNTMRVVLVPWAEEILSPPTLTIFVSVLD